MSTSIALSLCIAALLFGLWLAFQRDQADCAKVNDIAKLMKCGKYSNGNLIYPDAEANS